MTLDGLRKKTSFLEKLNKEDALLGLYEAVTKLNLATLKKDRQEVAKRLATILIGVSVAADTFKVKNLDKALESRLEEIRKALTIK